MAHRPTLWYEKEHYLVKKGHAYTRMKDTDQTKLGGGEAMKAHKSAPNLSISHDKRVFKVWMNVVAPPKNRTLHTFVP